MRYTVMIVFAALLFTACRKNAENSNCTLLKEGITANDLQQVSKAITNYINTLPTDEYTEANINLLVQTITGSCNIKSGAYCFDCIQTLPSQTEILLEFNAGGNTIRKTIDLTYTHGTTKMKFGNMHD